MLVWCDGGTFIFKWFGKKHVLTSNTFSEGDLGEKLFFQGMYPYLGSGVMGFVFEFMCVSSDSEVVFFFSPILGSSASGVNHADYYSCDSKLLPERSKWF